MAIASSRSYRVARSAYRAALLFLAALIASCASVRPQHRHQVIDRVHEFGPVVAARLAPAFAAAGVRFPPAELAYVAFKDSRTLEIYARSEPQSSWVFVKRYPVLGASGVLGPKLREGDRQVPEGIYPLQDFNANSRNHLALLIGYPNAFDRRMAEAEGRTALGGEIMIHGNEGSIGCLAMGDGAAEDFFVLTAVTGKEHVTVVISPTDFRRASSAPLPSQPPWVGELYDDLRSALREFPSP